MLEFNRHWNGMAAMHADLNFLGVVSYFFSRAGYIYIYIHIQPALIFPQQRSFASSDASLFLERTDRHGNRAQVGRGELGADCARRDGPQIYKNELEVRSDWDKKARGQASQQESEAREESERASEPKRKRGGEVSARSEQESES